MSPENSPHVDTHAHETILTTGDGSPPATENHYREDEGRCLYEPIAIVGMAMRLPGRIHNGEDLWNFLVNKESALCDVPTDRFNIDGFYNPSGSPGTIPVKQGYYLDDVELPQFDTTVFSMPRTELERLDPLQRQVLQVALECLENSGATSWRGSNMGCYIGQFGEDWADLFARETQHRGGYRCTSLGDFAVANRISYEFDLHGPSMTVKTACSSSLVCLDLACRAIQSGQCDSALVGGANLIFSPTTYLALNDQGVLSPNGQCRSFDASADGYARGEAINMILVKKLSHALRDNDTVRAIIRGTGVNADGRTNGLLTPSPTAQATLIRRTYEAAGIKDPSQTAIIECHGTGTPVGDPIETEAIGRCFGDQGIVITSVKPNLGHSEAAAGLTSLIKSVLTLERRKVLPNINFTKANPNISFDRYKFHVPTDVEDWPTGRAERIGVNSFGIGGVNAHVILESFRQFQSTAINPCNDQKSRNGAIHDEDLASIDNVSGKQVQNASGEITEHHMSESLLLFSAFSKESLAAQIEAYREYVDSHDVALGDLAYTLANKREHKPLRAFMVTNGTLTEGISETHSTDQSRPRLVWVFTGQGAQWPRMGADLMKSNTVFQRTIRKLDRYLQTLEQSPPWTIENEILNGEGSRVYGAELGHPLCVALQIALVDVLRSWGIEPDITLGHSSGETAAAYACGALTAEAAIFTATRRGISNVSSERQGSMAAVGLGSDEVREYLISGVDIACVNSQSSVTLSGDTEAVKQVLDNIKDQRPTAFTRMLRVEKAFHSHHMREYGPSYEDQLRQVRSVEPNVAFYSSVTGERIRGRGELEGPYWRANMECPVLFDTALRSALRDESNPVVLLEIGPHPALAGPIGQIVRDMNRSDVHIGTLTRGKNSRESILRTIGRLHQYSVPMDLSLICSPGAMIRDLPSYSWNQDTIHWEEPRVSHDWRFREHAPHELLGNRVTETASQPTWRKVLTLEDTLWLNGHVVNGQVVFPATGYIAMIGEAIRQLSGQTTYTLKNVQFTSARVLELGKAVELVTSLNPTVSDTSDSSVWWEFTITSFDGTDWVRNCCGEATGLPDKPQWLDSIGSQNLTFPRLVEGDSWYDVLKRVGFNYTGLFHGIKSISAATTSAAARATIATQVPGSGDNEQTTSSYTLHPAVLDQCLQLFMAAASGGQRRRLNSLAVPTFIDEIVISPSSLDLEATATITNMSNAGSWKGDLVAYGNSTPVLTLKGLKTTILTRNVTEDGVPLFTHVEWSPHSDFVRLVATQESQTPRSVEWPLLEELTTLCIFDHLEQITMHDSGADHLRKFLDWMRLHADGYQSGANKLIPTELGLHSLNHNQRIVRIHEIMARLSSSPHAVFSAAVYNLFSEASAIFAGTMHALHVLRKDDILSKLYDAMSFDWTDAIRLLANTNPRLRILEIGAGTGGTTAKVLKALHSEYGERLYSLYSYTDISAGFMAAAKERFANAQGMEYSVLDISRDPVEQGFSPGTYDLIIGANVLHATPCLNTTLRNVHSLLNPNGRLFLEELCPDSMFMNYIMGYLQGWWLGADDGRVNEPWISPARWAPELHAAGFQELESVVLDSPKPFHLSAGLIVSPANQTSIVRKMALLCHSLDAPYVTEMRERLEGLDVNVCICIFGQPLPDCDTIALLDLKEPVLHNMSGDSFDIIKEYLKSHKQRLFWVGQSSQIKCEDPRAAMVLGLARTARNEYSRDFFTIEVDNATSPSTVTEAVANIVRRHSIRPSSLNALDTDYEYAIVGGEILIPRFHWQTAACAIAEASEGKDHKGMLKRLTMTSPGLLHTMEWTDAAIQSPGNGEILVEVKAVGLNFRDVVVALGIVEGDPSEMGFEASGIIQAMGPGVDRFSIGDRVMFLSDGCFTTHMTLTESVCIKMDDAMSFIQAAAVPCVYATALMALVDVSRLQRGQSILIHAACGGVGLAALQIAQMIGADVYCTVGSDNKRSHLVDNYGLDPSRIFSSRDSSFLTSLMHATENRGVDVVLNSLSGDLLHASWRCVAEFGMMVEIGKRDFQRRAKLSMETFEANRTFVGLDLRGLSQSRPKKAAELLERCAELIRSGTLRGPLVSEIFPASELQTAYRTMQAAKHIGKIVIEMPLDPFSLARAHGCKPSSNSLLSSIDPVFRPDRSYLLVGGLGGLGRAIATWMVERGARNLVFLSRSANETPRLQCFLEDLRSQGCEVALVAGSVSCRTDVDMAVDTANAIHPLAGVLNLSMVLRDVELSDMHFDDWNAAIDPKVKGTWNLHNATLSLPLDFFLLFSSQSGLIGLWGQANYAAANTYLDAFVQYRHQHDLVASVIDVGVMGDVGYVADSDDIMNSLERTGMYILREQNLLEAISLALARSRPFTTTVADKTSRNFGQIVIGLNTTAPISSPSTRVAWKRDVRMSIYHTLSLSEETIPNITSPGSIPLKTLLAAELSEDEQVETIANALARTLADFLIKDEAEMATDRSLESLGMDSLVAMEMRNWIQQQVGIEISTLTINQSPSLIHLAKHISQVMKS
ncbi:putative polyketide synthase [Pseudomassariella vexata]|uniref:Putative polyketide synthase n=1 Tax=Pseudomassariella vexata TaxID=1141098 RepID=A0A1Y2DLJ8_9PEZI|nr:putative polyketide synthase [Pseudomassariella vexata]ORY60122.1 putative polyketide synthase [Pseudomassariella vexata]